MKIRLYQFTTREAADAIVGHGFLDGGQGCWFAPDPSTVCGEQARQMLLEVVLDLSEEELLDYRRHVTEEAIDPEMDELVPDPFPVGPYRWYQIPADVVNQRLVATRLVPPSERKLRAEGEWLEHAYCGRGERPQHRTADSSRLNESPWYTLAEADVLARRWEAQGPGWTAAYDTRTDLLTFSRPGRPPQTFRPLTIGLDGWG